MNESTQLLHRLSAAGKNRDEQANLALAKGIAARRNEAEVVELFNLLEQKSKDLQHDVIKVIYEIAVISPTLIAPFSGKLVQLLTHTSNRVQWGAMTALAAITAEVPATIFSFLPAIIEAAEKGSVITNDQCVYHLAKLAAEKRFEDACLAELNKRLQKAPVNQLPMYAEIFAPVINVKHRSAFVKTLSLRLNEIEKESKRLRVEKIIRKLLK